MLKMKVYDLCSFA